MRKVLLAVSEGRRESEGRGRQSDGCRARGSGSDKQWAGEATVGATAVFGEDGGQHNWTNLYPQLVLHHYNKYSTSVSLSFRQSSFLPLPSFFPPSHHSTIHRQ